MKKLATCIATLAVASTCAFGPAVVATADETSTTATTSDATTETSIQAQVDALLARSGFPADVQAKLRALAAVLPADTEQRLAAANARLGIESSFHDIARSVINPEDYQCTSTPLQDWLDAQVTPEEAFPLLFLMAVSGTDLPMYDAIFYGVESKANSFGPKGEYTNLLTAQMTDLRRFWDIDGAQVQLVPMKASIFQNRDRMLQIYTWLLGDEQLATRYVDFVQAIISVTPNLSKNPILTFNAFAVDPSDEPELAGQGVTKMIAMGDGVLQGTQSIGLSNFAAPRAILAHEYGHHVQYAKNLFQTDLPTEPERTRRTELMADALGTYFMVHAQGEALNAARTLDDQKAFYNVGDCGFTEDGHHGTPNQRFRSAGWAVSVANDAANQGRKLKAVDFATRFDAKLPDLVAPDAS